MSGETHSQYTLNRGLSIAERVKVDKGPGFACTGGVRTQEPIVSTSRFRPFVLSLGGMCLGLALTTLMLVLMAEHPAFAPDGIPITRPEGPAGAELVAGLVGFNVLIFSTIAAAIAASSGTDARPRPVAASALAIGGWLSPFAVGMLPSSVHGTVCGGAILAAVLFLSLSFRQDAPVAV